MRLFTMVERGQKVIQIFDRLYTGGVSQVSFVYAQKIKNSIAILADTKITFCQVDSKTLFSQKSTKNIRQFGMIKNIIISRNLCVSYAGNNIILANNLLNKIDHISLSELLNMALETNRLDPKNGAEFIICYADNKRQHIFQVKNGECKDVPLAWIGNSDAFRYFRGVRTGAFSSTVKSNNPFGVEIFFGTSPKSEVEKEYQAVFDAFHKTVFDCEVDDVGGFVIPILFDTERNQFIYKGYIKDYCVMQRSPFGTSLQMCQGPETGAYSILFYESPTIVGVYIPQNQWGIIYNHYRAENSDYTINQTKSFLIPTATKISQLDFYVQTSAKGMCAPGFLGFNPDRIEDYLDRIRFYKNDPNLAILYVLKAIEIVTTQHREEWRLPELLQIKENIQARIDAGGEI